MNIFEHYTLDWLAMILTLLAIYLLGNKNREGFIVMILGNVLWIALGIFISSIAMIAGNFIFILMNTWCFIRWSAKSNSQTQ